jgi:hypothetical protein
MSFAGVRDVPITRAPAAAAPHRVHQHGLRHREAHLQEEGIERGHEHLGDSARVGERHPGGHGHELARVQHHRLRIATAPDDRHHAVAHARRSLFLGALSDGIDGPRELEPGHVLRPPGRRRVGAPALEQVGAVQPGGGHPHANLTVPGDRERELPDLQHLGPAGLSDHDRAHRGLAHGHRLAPRD